jgi:hypothetical protein
MQLERASSCRRKLGEFIARSRWSEHEFTAAIGAFATKTVFDTSGTKSAFKRANSRVRCAVGQVFIAALTVGADLKHLAVSCFLASRKYMHSRFLISLQSVNHQFRHIG